MSRGRSFADLASGGEDAVLARLLQAAEAAGSKPKRNGVGTKFHCPCHDDRNASGSFFIGKDGNAHLKCHAGCPEADLLEAFGLTKDDLRVEGVPGKLGREIAAYSYTDEKGRLLFQTVRFEPKTFRQRRSDGNGGWTNNLGDVRRVLYALPRLLQAKRKGLPIYVVEGEKDADAINALDPNCKRHAATTSPMGAGKWRDEYAEALGGAKRVVVWADADEPGRKHAADVVASLRGKVAEVVVVQASEGKDAADHLAAGRGLEEAQPVDLQASAPTVPFQPTDGYNADLFAEQHQAKARYAHDLRSWVIWDGRHWSHDETSEAVRLARETVRSLFDLAAAERNDDQRKRLYAHACRSDQAPKIESMVRLARAHPKVATTSASFDRDPCLLNVANGTLDLREGTVRPHAKDDLLSHLVRIDFDPKAQAPRWQAFLERVLVVLGPGGKVDQKASAELRSWVQRAVGYSLTGEVSEQCLFLLHGEGANGKSTFLEVLRAILGGRLAQVMPFAVLLQKRGDEGISNDVARLRGARFVVSVEPNAGERLNEAKVKWLTGGDTIAARRLYQETVEFQATHKLWLACNHRPDIRGTDYAIWRRVKCIDFPVTIPKSEQDPNLKAKLLEEAAGVLAWAVEGCVAWRRSGLGDCRAVELATKSYRDEQDRFAIFLDDMCEVAPKEFTPSAELNLAYIVWAESNSEPKLSANLFASRLRQHLPQVEPERRKQGRTVTRGWRGIRLVKDGFGRR